MLRKWEKKREEEKNFIKKVVFKEKHVLREAFCSTFFYHLKTLCFKIIDLLNPIRSLLTLIKMEL